MGCGHLQPPGDRRANMDPPNRRPGIITVTASLLLVLGVLAFIRWERADTDALIIARKTGVVRVGYAVEAPYAFLTPEGKVTGESPEIARVITSRLGIQRVEWRLTEFGDLLDGLEAGRFDVIAAGMFITSERRQRVAFSLPTFRVNPGLLVRKGNPLALHSYSDLLAKTNARVAVLSGSVEESLIHQLGLPRERCVQVPDAASGQSVVRSGRADALALSAPTLRWMMMNPIAGLTEMAEPFLATTTDAPLEGALGGFAFRKGDQTLCQAWNVELATFVGSEEHRRLVAPFGFTDAELPSPVAATQKATRL